MPLYYIWHERILEWSQKIYDSWRIFNKSRPPYLNFSPLWTADDSLQPTRCDLLCIVEIIKRNNCLVREATHEHGIILKRIMFADGYWERCVIKSEFIYLEMFSPIIKCVRWVLHVNRILQTRVRYLSIA